MQRPGNSPASRAVLLGRVRSVGHASAVLSGLAAGDRHRRVLDRHHQRAAGGDALHHAALRHRASPKSAMRLRGGMMISVLATAIGFAAVGAAAPAAGALSDLCRSPACMWTPMMPLTDAYALRGVVRYGLDYGPLRLWGSAAFVAGALVCGFLVDVIAAARADLGHRRLGSRLRAATSLLLQPLDDARRQDGRGCTAAMRCCAMAAFCGHHRGGADPGQPRRLLHLLVDQLAGPRARRAHDRGPLDAGRARRDRGLRAVAALHRCSRHR